MKICVNVSSKAAAEIRDPIHGYVYIEDDEKDIIDNPIFQRLRRIRQLSGAHITYPGAQHTRFDHSIGAMHLAKLAATRLTQIIDLKSEQIGEIKMAALLHDSGHGPFSHLFFHFPFSHFLEHREAAYLFILLRAPGRPSFLSFFLFLIFLVQGGYLFIYSSVGGFC